MLYYTDRIESEIKNIFGFWMKHASDGERIYPEVYANGFKNENAPLGSGYLAGVIYGSSKGCEYLKDRNVLTLGQIAFQQLISELKNPDGGFLYGKNPDGTLIHNPQLVSLAQASILNALSEFYIHTNSDRVLKEINMLVDLIESHIADIEMGGYFDGYHRNWHADKAQQKTLVTHLRMMEAFSACYKATGNEQAHIKLEELIGLMICQIIDQQRMLATANLTPDWNIISTNHSVGHNAEAAWLLHKCAVESGNKHFIAQTKNIVIEITSRIIDTAFDDQFGGVFNIMNEHYSPCETSKEYWVQAETTLALLNSYELTSENTFLSFAIRLFEYIDNTFADNKAGEWFDSVTREGVPFTSKPKLHFHKSMHHNMRYCVEASKRMKRISEKVYQGM